LIPKFASEVAARVCELRNRDTKLEADRLKEIMTARHDA
jgi:hypothetical protein